MTSNVDLGIGRILDQYFISISFHNRLELEPLRSLPIHGHL